MTRLTLRPLTAADLDAAAALLAARHARDRQQAPALPERFGAAAVRPLLAAALEEPGAAGYLALRGAEPAGYLLGRGLPAALRPRAAWCGYSEYALAREEQVETLRALYAALAPQWLAGGYFAHYTLVAAGDAAALAGWQSLGFGREQVHALRPVTPLPAGGPAAAYTMRAGTIADLDAIVRLGEGLPRLQAQSPVFAPLPPEQLRGLREGYAEALTEAETRCHLACVDGEPVALHLLAPAAAGPMTPERCLELSVAVTAPERRGSGAGSALLRHTLAWAAEAGYAWVQADWRSANLSAAAFWGGRGFRPVAYRLHRAIDERIAWAGA